MIASFILPLDRVDGEGGQHSLTRVSDHHPGPITWAGTETVLAHSQHNQSYKLSEHSSTIVVLVAASLDCGTCDECIIFLPLEGWGRDAPTVSAGQGEGEAF